MNRSWLPLVAIGLAAGAIITVAVRAPLTPASAADATRGRYVPVGGSVTFHFDRVAVESLGLGFVAHGHIEDISNEHHVAFEIRASDVLETVSKAGVVERIAGGAFHTTGALQFTRAAPLNSVGQFSVRATGEGTWVVMNGLSGQSYPVFDVAGAVFDFNEATGRLRVVGDLAVSRTWAEFLGLPADADLWAGTILIEADIVPVREGEEPAAAGRVRRADQPDGEGAVAAAGTIGTDVIVADLQSVQKQGWVGGIAGYAVGTTACNLGDEPANWNANPSNQHPVIVQNIYRLKDDKFEQIGLSWVKHGFFAVSQYVCAPPCQNPGDPDCCDPLSTDGSQLGVMCSDPYNAQLNGAQNNMNPRYQVNARTGEHPAGWSGPAHESVIARRMQVRDEDVNPALNAGARYFVQGHYVLEDDCRAGTQDNNASYRRVATYENQPGSFLVTVFACVGGANDGAGCISGTNCPGGTCTNVWSTQREQPAVRAWQDEDTTVVEADIRVPGEGLFILAAKAIDLGGGMWRYSYALQNLNSDRSGRSFRVPIAPGVQVSNVGFHAVDYHSAGELIVNAPWQTTVESFSVTWACLPYEVNEYANALRFGTVNSFYFDTNTPPEPATITIGLFKPGQPTLVTAETIGPSLIVEDCNGNEIPDEQDILEGTSLDCDANGVPDECQLDCNGNEVADTCDLTLGTSSDCNANAVPDECEIDCNSNGVPDDCDVADCDGSLWCTDCNGAGVPDVCKFDCDGDGVPTVCDDDEDSDADGWDDCYDLCPLTTPPDVCICPDVVCCNHPIFGECFAMYTPEFCLEIGGTPDCIPGDACREGCLIGDFDFDGDIDWDDMAFLVGGLSGPSGGPGFEPPSEALLFSFDWDEDGDIDMYDVKKTVDKFMGP